MPQAVITPMPVLATSKSAHNTPTNVQSIAHLPAEKKPSRKLIIPIVIIATTLLAVAVVAIIIIVIRNRNKKNQKNVPKEFVPVPEQIEDDISDDDEEEEVRRSPPSSKSTVVEQIDAPTHIDAELSNVLEVAKKLGLSTTRSQVSSPRIQEKRQPTTKELMERYAKMASELYDDDDSSPQTPVKAVKVSSERPVEQPLPRVSYQDIDNISDVKKNKTPVKTAEKEASPEKKTNDMNPEITAAYLKGLMSKLKSQGEEGVIGVIKEEDQ